MNKESLQLWPCLASIAPFPTEKVVMPVYNVSHNRKAYLPRRSSNDERNILWNNFLLRHFNSFEKELETLVTRKDCGQQGQREDVHQDVVWASDWQATLRSAVRSRTGLVRLPSLQRLGIGNEVDERARQMCTDQGAKLNWSRRQTADDWHLIQFSLNSSYSRWNIGFEL